MTFTEHLRAQRRSGAVLIVMGVCVSACTRREDSAPVAQGAPAAVSQRENATPEEVVRSPGEAARQFARRIIPSGAELAFDPVEVPAGPPGSRLVILFRNSTSLSNYTGWILSPSDGDPTRYRKVVLPAMDEAAGLFDINVKAVFAAEAGGSSGPALVVLYQYYRTGTGRDPGDAAYVYRWMDGSLTVDTKASAALLGVRSESAARAKLAAIKK